MSWLKSWQGWRRYSRLGPEWKRIVFYSESGQDWHVFEPLISELLDRHGERITYISSDSGDPGLALQHTGYRAIYLPEGLFLIIHFQVLKARLLILTMMDLGNLQLKKSIHPVHYLYLFHSMGSTHMVDHANSYDAYDSLFCVGPHHVAELRRRETLADLPARHLFQYGHPRLEQLRREADNREDAPETGAPPVVLIAPTWGDHAILNACGTSLIETLLDAGMHVILRPHHHTARLTPSLIRDLHERFGGHPRFESVMQMGETDSLFRSDVVVCDWSAMAIEYFLGLGKPVLFIDLPRRIRNPDWKDWGLEPFESSIREHAGATLPPREMARVPECIRQLLFERKDLEEHAAEIRARAVFNFGHSVKAGADEIVRLAAELSGRENPGSAHD